jgi:spore coat polysaccharide biosynthesis predicted glycosyltransferase SpsG
MNLVWLLFDAAFDTGLGHIARLIALGQRLELEGIPFCFHGTKEPPAALVNLILQNGLNPQCECGGSPTLIIADTYNSELLHATSKNHHVSIVQLIDEVSDFSAANALVEASPIDPSRKYGQSRPVLKFSDSPFLRDEIISAKRFANKPPSPKLKVVMILGGVDDLNYLTMLNALWKVQQLEEFEVTVFSSSDRVTEFSIQNGFTVSSELVRISQISEEYDFVISASGVTAWELSYLGVPGFVVSIAENQNFQLKYLNARRIRDGVEVGDSNLAGFILGQIRNASKTTYDTEILNGVPRVIEFLRRNNLIK